MPLSCAPCFEVLAGELLAREVELGVGAAVATRSSHLRCQTA